MTTTEDFDPKVFGFEQFRNRRQNRQNNEPKPDWNLQLICANDVKEKPILWLWHGWLARGHMHILAGQMGIGKSTIAIKLIAIITKGETFPGGNQCEPGNVIIWSGEDTIEDTLKPRLMQAGADCNRVYFANEMKDGDKKRPFDPAIDMPKLQQSIKQLGNVSLVLIDPIVSATSGDSHKNAETRRGLQPVIDLAKETGAAVLGITHFTKGSKGADPRERVTGSLAFAAMARVVMVAIEGETPEAPNAFMRAKANNAPSTGGFEYTLGVGHPFHDHPDVEVSFVKFGEAIVGTAKDKLDAAEGVKRASKGDEAQGFLFNLLQYEPMLENDVKEAAKKGRISERTLRRAKVDLRIVSEREKKADGKWVWSLPPIAGRDTF